MGERQKWSLGLRNGMRVRTKGEYGRKMWSKRRWIDSDNADAEDEGELWREELT